MKHITVFTTLLGVLFSAYAQEDIPQFSYDDYATVLKTFVDNQGMINYKNLKANREELDAFVSNIGELNPSVATLLFTLAVFAVDKAVFVIDQFSGELNDKGLPKGWKPLTFEKIKRHTKYSLKHENGDYFVKAESNVSASGIYKEVEINPKEYPYLSWRWKVENTIKKGDARKKEGDDYPARIYVTFRFNPDKASFFEKMKYGMVKKIRGRYPPKGAINYIWANRLSKGKAIDSAYTDRSKMIAVESGTENLNEWLKEKRNIYADYKKLFKEEPPMINGIFLMTDSDNTKESATAYYDDIIFRKGKK